MSRLKTIEITQEKDALDLVTIRFSIDNLWEIDDFVSFFDSFKTIYNFYVAYLEILNDLDSVRDIKFGKEEHFQALFSRNISNMFKIVVRKRGEVPSYRGEYPLIKVKAIKYSSPGYSDLIGIAQVIGHLKEILINYLPNKKTKKELQILEQERISKLIDNLKAIGLNNNEIQRIVLFQDLEFLNIKQLIDEKKIISIDLTQKSIKK